MSLRGHWLRFCESIWVWAIALVLTVAVCLFMTGCASFDYQWVKRHEPMQNIRVVQVREVNAVCQHYARTQGGGEMIGCARRDYADGVCIIYLPLDYPQWLLDHERRHCLTGEDHE